MAMLAGGLESLRAEFNIVNPQRGRDSDGWIGDARHAASVSDHNPDDGGVVHAIDVDVDGVPMARIVLFLVGECRAGRENRLQNIIYNRAIWSRSWGWRKRAYKGSNPHTQHAHFSAVRGRGANVPGAWGVAARFREVRTESQPVKPGKKAASHRPGSRRLEVVSPRLKGADVRHVQEWIGPKCGPADGEYGPKAAAGVRWYQRMRGIQADGVVGPYTWAHMGVKWSG